ncbi:MAG: SoxR reducing system RseC family protein [Christensenellaceae bacterium]|nr:SoxR reducing system RseC family protein [Christensenellaceae bacterium]
MDNSLKSIGTVTELNGDKAKVVFKRSKACGNCKSCINFGTDEAIVEINNSLDAKVGDRVEIALHSSSMLKASLIMYGIPIVALLLGVYLGCKINDIWGAVIGITAAILSLSVIRLFESKLSRLGQFDPSMLSIIQSDNE